MSDAPLTPAAHLNDRRHAATVALYDAASTLAQRHNTPDALQAMSEPLTGDVTEQHVQQMERFAAFLQALVGPQSNVQVYTTPEEAQQ